MNDTGYISNGENEVTMEYEDGDDGFYLRILDEDEFDTVWDEFERIIEEEW